MSKSKFLKMDNLSLQHILDDDADLIPLMTPEDEELINNEILPESLAIVTVKVVLSSVFCVINDGIARFSFCWKGDPSKLV